MAFVELVLATHESSLAHDTGPRHPERAARIPAIVEGVTSVGIPVIDVHPEPAERGLLELVHDSRYIDSIETFCAQGGGALDLDTYASPASWEAGLRAAAAGAEVCAVLREGSGDLGYVAMRPPGHHAVSAQAMGFCLFNNVAITAADLVERGDRVAIVDWDVHHGNGTQDIFYRSESVLYMSVHEAGIYPGTGHWDEVGESSAAGTNINVPVPAGTGGALHRAVVERVFAPVAAQFEADWLLVSAGYDAHLADPLANLRLIADDYMVMAALLGHAVPSSRTVVFLEGGYDIDALRESAAATVDGWLQPQVRRPEAPVGADSDGELRRAIGIAGRYWSVE